MTYHPVAAGYHQYSSHIIGKISRECITYSTRGHTMTKLVLSTQTICSNDNTFILSFVEKKPSLIVKISSVCSEDPSDSGCETSAPLSPPAPEIKIEEPAIRKQLVQVEESVDDALFEELFRNAPEQQVQPSKQVSKMRHFSN